MGVTLKWAESPEDFAECQKILGHPEIWPHHTPYPQPVIDVSHEQCLFQKDACLFLFRAIDGLQDEWECHTSVLPERRNLSFLYATAARRMFFEKFPAAERLWTLVPEYNKPAARLARSVGFEETHSAYGLWKDQMVTYFVLTRERHNELKNQGVVQKCQQQSL